MTWKDIPGRSGWQFNDAPTLPTKNYLSRQTSRNRQVNTVGGVRTEQGRQVYAQTRYLGDPTDLGFSRGEISATHANARVGVTGVQSAAYYTALGGGGGGGGGAAATDPSFANVSFLLSTSGGVTVTDASNNGYTIGQTTPNFSTDTPGAAFTDNSLKFTGFSSEQITTASNSMTDIGFAGDFTIEFWFKSGGSATNFPILIPSSSGSQSWGIKVLSSVIAWDTNYTFTTGFTGSTGIKTNEWIFIAISRSGGTTGFWVNGNFEGSFADSNVYDNDDLKIGTPVANLNFLINNLRITEGQALYSGSGAYSIPTTPFPTS